MSSILRLVISLALLAGVAACLDRSPTAPDEEREGVIRFDYALASGGGGTFRAEGEAAFMPGGAPRHGTWAAAFYGVPLESSLTLAGYRAADEPDGAAILIHLGVATAMGSLELGPEGCAPHEEDGQCRMFSLSMDVAIDALADFHLAATEGLDVYEVREGTVEIVEIEKGRIRGSFSGAGAMSGDAERTITLSSGWFDMPIFGEY